MDSVSPSEKLRQKLHLKKYLEELSLLAGYSVSEKEIVGLKQTQEICQASLKFDVQPVARYKVPFSEKLDDRFKEFIQKLSNANSSPLLVWTPRTIMCGTFRIPSLDKINWNFDFCINKEGVLAFLTEDICDRLLLDFSCSSSGTQELIIEVQGEHWLKITYQLTLRSAQRLQLLIGMS